MSSLLAKIVGVVIELVVDALTGDEQASQKLKDILPKEMRTELVAQRQDELDRAKFGPRTWPG